MKRNYRVVLVNNDPQLDLHTKSEAIRKVLRNLCDNAGKSRFKGLHSFDDPTINKDHILVTVDETSKSWHCSFGKRLANDHGMRAYCNPRHKEQLFRWN